MSEKTEINNPEERAASLRSWIRLNLGLKGFTIRSFAKKHGVKPGTVAVAFSRPYPRMERLIGDTLGIPPEQIWPWRYDSAGRPNRFNTWYLRGRGLWVRKSNNSGIGVQVNQKKEATRDESA